MLDIKSKSNKKITLFLSVGFLLTVAIGLYFSYSTLGERASIFIDIEENTQEYTENLFGRLYQQNYIFYRDYQEFIEKKEISFGDVYLNVQRKNISLEDAKQEQKEQTQDYLEIEEFEDFYEENEIYNVITECWKNVNTKMEMWVDNNSSLIQKELDYCVIQSSDGYITKNTNMDLQLALTGTEEQKAQLLREYLFFVLFSYDDSGRLETIQTKGENENELLKIAKSKEKQQKIFSDLVYYVTDNEGKQIQKVILNFGTPKDITIIYGMTKQQWETFIQPVPDTKDQLWIQVSAYERAGVRGILYIIFLGLSIGVFLLPKIPDYQLYKYSLFQRIPLEITGLIGVLCLSIGIDKILEIMIQTNQDYYLKQWGTIYISTIDISNLLIATYNIIILFFIFAIWFGAATTLYPIQKQGIRVYLSQRCISYSMLINIKNWMKNFWKELTTYDLSRRTEWLLLRLVLCNLAILVVITELFGATGLVLYSIILLFLLYRWMMSIKRQYETLLSCTQQLSDGDLNTQIEIDTGIFQTVLEELTQIQTGLKNAVEEELKSQKMKTELITNVSHDLKTPLTAIITYIDLLKQENLSSKQQEEYLTTLEKKAHRLKDLIEDLFEISKATSNNVTLNIVDVNIISLIKQVWLELSDRIEESQLDFRFDFPEEKVILPLDSQKTYRIFENLYINIFKYAMPKTRVYVSAKYIGDTLKIELKNISAAELTINPCELAERFVRGDSSRNTEGSGLGLAIAKSFVELQKGRMEIETDGDLFKVALWWQIDLQENYQN